jgi:hypothetical protein
MSFAGSTFNDYNDDGLPDDSNAAVLVDTDRDGVPDLTVRLGTLFADTDDDGVPDTRVLALGGSPAGYVRASIARAGMDVVRAADRQQLDAALDAMEAAIANARRELSRER